MGVARLASVGRPVAISGVVFPVLAGVAAWLPGVGLDGCARAGSWAWGPLTGIAVAVAAIMLDGRRTVVLATGVGFLLGCLLAIREVGPGYPGCTQEALSVMVVDAAVLLGLVAYRTQVTRTWTLGRIQRDAAHADLVAAAHARAVSGTRRELLALAMRVAEPVLSGLAEGRLDPADPEVRADCARAEATLRAVATIPVADPGGAGQRLTGLVVAAHERGVELTLSLNADLDQDVDLVRRGADMLSAALAACPSGSTARVTVLQSEADLIGLILIDARPTSGPDAGAAGSSGDPAIVSQLAGSLRTQGWSVTELGGELLAETRWGAG